MADGDRRLLLADEGETQAQPSSNLGLYSDHVRCSPGYDDL